MKYMIILCLVGLAACQLTTTDHFGRQTSRRSSSGSRRKSSSSGSRSSRSRSSGSRSSGRSSGRSSSSGSHSSSSSGRSSSSGGGAPVDATNGGSAYHFSWVHDNNRKYTGDGAARYCTKLQGSGWQAVGISDRAEDRFITNIITGKNLQYIWTGGKKAGSGWSWRNRETFSYTNWSHTGGFRPPRPQPDNRSRPENCIAILNNFYKDGVKWHDVGCSHKKPVICERKA